MNGSGASFCAVTNAGAVWCWGYNPSALLGYDGDSSSYARPVMQSLTSAFGASIAASIATA